MLQIPRGAFAYYWEKAGFAKCGALEVAILLNLNSRFLH
jgi:hypothetical protein